MDNCICKIIKQNGETGTGFFCKIKFKGHPISLPLLATNNHVLNKDDLMINNIVSIIFNEDKQIRKIYIDNKRKVYTNEDLDATFIELKPNDNIENFLEVDEDIINQKKDILNLTFQKQSIYILHYPGGKNVEVSYGLSINIDEENITHNCNTLDGSSGAPILSLESFKVIGIHYGGIKSNNMKYNKGTFIKYPISEYNKYFFNRNIMTIIYERKYDSENDIPMFIQIFRRQFIENNKNNCIIIINSINFDYAIHLTKI
jgi:hypothetical protein